ncbi:MAG: hypothetical protein ACRYFS_10080 [Janthinobacterium lividum]
MINGPGAMQQAVAERRTQVGGDWFFWIAGFSVINSVLLFTGVHIQFVLGLGITDRINSVVNGLSQGAAIGLDILASAFFALFGLFSRKGALWAFVVGAVFYAMDGVLLVKSSNWFSLAFHAYALYRIFGGFQAAQQLGVLRKQQASFGNSGYVPPSSTPSNDVWPPPPRA